MMPKRWLESNSGANELERTVLALSPDPEPEPGEQERVWQSLLACLPPPTDPDGSAPPNPPPSGSVSTGTLLANHGLGFAAGVVTTTLAFLLIVPRVSQHPSPSSTVPAASAVPATMITPAPSGRLTLEKVERRRPVRSRPVMPKPSSNPASDSASVPRAASSLSEEVALLREARSRLSRGDLEGASQVLATSKAKFPNARLAQEREAANIELLRRSGDARAAIRARAFLAKYPRSPHARQVERALETVGD